MTRYSQIKPIIKQLHSDKWYKAVGVPCYRKVWTNGDKRYGQMIDINELLYTNVPTQRILDYYNQKAINVFKDLE